MAQRSGKRRVFYGWYIVLGAALIVAIAYSMRYSFTIFYKAILDEFGWSRADTAAAFSVSLLIYGLSSPFTGTLADKFGPRKVLAAGTLLLAVGLFAMSYMNSIWLFYLFLGVVMAVGTNSIGFAVHNAYIPNWFVERRGTAFGFLLAGAGVANILVSQYQRMVLSFGWRTTYQVLSLITLAVILPVIFFIIRGTPQEKGLLPDGATDDPAGKTKEDNRKAKSSSLVVNKEWAATDWTLNRAIKTPSLWFLFFVQLTASIAFNLTSAHQPVYCQDLGFDPIFAASVFGLTGAMSVMGNLMSSISDRLGSCEVTFTIGTVGAVTGTFALLSANAAQPWLLYAYSIMSGLFAGAGTPSMISGAADMFSGKHFGAINGFIILGFGIGGAIGPWVGGIVYDTMGNYTLAFIAVMAAQISSCIFLWLAAPRKVRLVSGKAPKVVETKHESAQ